MFQSFRFHCNISLSFHWTKFYRNANDLMASCVHSQVVGVWNREKKRVEWEGHFDPNSPLHTYTLTHTEKCTKVVAVSLGWSWPRANSLRASSIFLSILSSNGHCYLITTHTFPRVTHCDPLNASLAIQLVCRNESTSFLSENTKFMISV